MDETALHFVVRLKFSSHFNRLLLNRGADLKICDAVSNAFHYNYFYESCNQLQL